MPLSVSLIIPIYNEAAHLERFLTQLDATPFPLPTEFILVNDGSTDNTQGIIRQHRFRSRIISIEAPANRGKGAAIQLGIAAATGDIIGIQDADFEYDPADIATLVGLIARDECDVVYGTRFAKVQRKIPINLHTLANRSLTWLSNLASGLKLTDMETCYKFFRRDIIRNIHLVSPRFGFEPEITAKLARLKIRLREVPVSYTGRDARAGKKIGWRDGVAALWHLLYFNLILSRKKFYKESMPAEFILDIPLNRKKHSPC